MPQLTRIYPVVWIISLVGLSLQPVSVRSETQAPLSVIDWLGTQAEPQGDDQGIVPNLDEPPVSLGALAPQVDVKPLGEGAPREIGLVPAAITGLPADLWVGSDVETLTRLIRAVPDVTLPAAQS